MIPLSQISKTKSKQSLTLMTSDKKVASPVGAKTARACDSCIRKRARWYCAADDAFLCQVCDGSVHSANPLARRHERVRLKTASLNREPCLPTWHRGPTKKARTPRNRKQQLVVPELDSSTSQDDGHDEEQLLYRVPVYDPFVAELSGSTVTTSNEFGVGFDVSDFDMDDFAVDVEALLGKGLDGESYGIEELGLLDCQEIKAEKEVMREPLELNFNYESSTTSEGDMKVIKEHVVREKGRYETANKEKREWKMSLRLDYDAISEAWANQGSPWMNGKRPNITPHDCWPQTTLGGCGTYRDPGMVRGEAASGDGNGREARVLRYREKRRTRLFSKKIRYEVRKLNAEKRPRMKGRFVKRSSLNPTTPFSLLTQ